ncbi:diaminopimelate epimerase [Micromonospora sp. NPDC047074]|uniref:diaminopimelate epimerase n=1 Tax=Micromonospora sp. NPDC047074 TaxID=3154339 RepID=UPI0033CD112A
MQFTKGHGTGNDFVILPDPDNRLDLTPGLVAALCDRRRGIGGDGVLRVVRAAKHPEGVDLSGEAEWFMDYWNADGSFAEMCGNGARVFVRYLVATGLAEPAASGAAEAAGAGEALPVATRAGVVRALVTADAIAVEMRRPRLYDTSTASLGGLTLPGTAVDVGNPHLVCALPAGLELTGLDLTRAPDVDPAAFPSGVNVEFTASGEPVDGADGHVLMRVYERGSAETLSCGTGACAVAAVALRDAGRDTGVIAVDVPGGRLSVTVTEDSCWLAGPAVLIATGTIDPTALTPHP